MNKCEQIQIRMLEGASLSEEEKCHLNACPDCRSLEEFASRMETVPFPEQEIPGHIDAAILGYAEAAVKPVRWKPVFWKVAVPAAAAFAMFAGVVFYQPGKKIPHPVKKADTVAVSTQDLFDDQVISLAMDVGSEMDSFTETMDLLI